MADAFIYQEELRCGVSRLLGFGCLVEFSGMPGSQQLTEVRGSKPT